MAIALKQSTASQEIPLGPFVDSTDGNTAETGLSPANTDIKIWKTGATTLANKTSLGATHMANGVYYAVLDATDTDTLGPLVVYCHMSGALPVKTECVVLPANVYDSTISATDKLQVDVQEWLGTAPATPTTAGVPEVDITHIAGAAVSTSTAQLGVNAVQAGGTAWASGAITAASIATDAITAAKIATDAIGASELAADAVTEIAAGVFARAFSAAYGSLTFDEMVKVMAAVLVGKASGLATTTATYRNLADSADVIVATVDADGNRTAVTRTP